MTITVDRHRGGGVGTAALDADRRRVGVLIGVTTTVLQGYIPPDSFFNAAMVPSLPFILIVAALLILPGMRSLDASRDPLATIDPPPPPIAATTRAPTHGPHHPGAVVDPLRRLLCVHADLDTGHPAWTTVFNNGLTLSIVLLSITLITGMAGQLSLCQATLGRDRRLHRRPAGQPPRSQPARRRTRRRGVGGRRRRGPGCPLAAAAGTGPGVDDAWLPPWLFDATFFNETYITGGQEGLSIQSKWLGTSEFFNFNGHAMFLLSLGVLVVVVVVVLLVRKGTVGRNLAAMRGSETATAGLGVNPTWQRILVFALSGAIAGIGGLLHSLEQQVVDPNATGTPTSRSSSSCSS